MLQLEWLIMYYKSHLIKTNDISFNKANKKV